MEPNLKDADEALGRLDKTYYAVLSNVHATHPNAPLGYESGNISAKDLVIVIEAYRKIRQKKKEVGYD